MNLEYPGHTSAVCRPHPLAAAGRTDLSPQQHPQATGVCAMATQTAMLRLHKTALAGVAAWPSRLSRAASLWRCAVARGVALLGGTPSMQRRFLLPQVPHPLPEMSHAERGCMRRPGCFPCHDSGPRQAFFCCHGRCRAACRCGAENSDHVPAPAAQKRRIRVANSALPCRTPGCATSVREAAPT